MLMPTPVLPILLMMVATDAGVQDKPFQITFGYFPYIPFTTPENLDPLVA